MAWIPARFLSWAPGKALALVELSRQHLNNASLPTSCFESQYLGQPRGLAGRYSVLCQLKSCLKGLYCNINLIIGDLPNLGSCRNTTTCTSGFSPPLESQGPHAWSAQVKSCELKRFKYSRFYHKEPSTRICSQSRLLVSAARAC